MRARTKSGIQLNIFGKNAEAGGTQELRDRHKVKKIRGEFIYQEDNRYYHRFRIETKNEEILGAVYISKDVNPLPDRIILERKRS